MEMVTIGAGADHANGAVVNGDTSAETPDTKHKVNGNAEPAAIKSKLSADGSNNNDIDSIPCV